MDSFPLKTQILKKEQRAYLYPKTYKYDLETLEKENKKINTLKQQILELSMYINTPD